MIWRLTKRSIYRLMELPPCWAKAQNSRLKAVRTTIRRRSCAVYRFRRAGRSAPVPRGQWPWPRSGHTPTTPARTVPQSAAGGNQQHQQPAPVWQQEAARAQRLAVDASGMLEMTVAAEEITSPATMPMAARAKPIAQLYSSCT